MGYLVQPYKMRVCGRTTIHDKNEGVINMYSFCVFCFIFFWATTRRSSARAVWCCVIISQIWDISQTTGRGDAIGQIQISRNILKHINSY